MLYMIGIGLAYAEDISVRALSILKSCDYIYIDSYTSFLEEGIDKLERLYGKKVTTASREMVESADIILGRAKTSKVAFLVVGDIFAATTHVDLWLRAKREGITVKAMHNASVMTAIGETGLDLYKFGRTTSIPFQNENVDSPVKVLEENRKDGLHTLFLLDLVPVERRSMSAAQAASYLIAHKVKPGTRAVACAALGGDSQIIVAGTLKQISETAVDTYPQCLIIPGKLHFIEEEMLSLYKGL